MERWKSRLAGLLLAMALPFPTLAPAETAAPRVPAEKLAVQLYSLHADLKADLEGTLTQVRQMGLQQVELYSSFGLAPAELRALLDRVGLKAIGSHVWLKDLKSDLPGIIARARALDLAYVGVAWVKQGPAPLSVADMDDVAATYKAACPALQAAGIGLMYHIHGYELAGLEQENSLFDRLMAATDPACVSVELDVFWAAKAGIDPVALLRRYPDRIRMLHLKDISPNAARRDDGTAEKSDFVPVGSGAINWPALLAAAKGVDWFVLEDESDDAAAHLRQSRAYLLGD